MLKTISNFALLLGISTALSGCLVTRNQDFNQAAREAIELADDLEDLDRVAPGDLPDSGTATYSGIATLNYDRMREIGSENNDYFADITFETDFGTGEVEGSMTNFESPEGEVDGQLVLVNGEVEGNGVDGDFEGTLNDDGDEIEVDVDVDSSFLGDGVGDPAGLIGELEGLYVINGDQTGEMVGTFVTEFVSP